MNSSVCVGKASACHSAQPADSMKPFAILIIDDEPGICDFLQRALSGVYHRVDTVQNTAQADAQLQAQHYDVLLVDICMPGCSGIEWLKQRQSDPQAIPAAVILMTGFAELESAVEAIRLGATDFIAKPFRLEQMLSAVARCYQQYQLQRDNFLLRRQLAEVEESATMVGQSPAMVELQQLIGRVAPAKSAVLIEGETGTGKELVAEALHQHSGRRGAFVPVNCAAIAPELIESELFGHVKGAFSGADRSRDGLFRFADGGTLFLDEVAELPASLQARLLRVLETAQVRPVGSEQHYTIDVRIIAACNVSLTDEVAAGRFRQDLFYRLNVLPLQLPPLRERREDIPALAHHFCQQLSRQLHLTPIPLSAQDLMALQQYHWPGNVRELRNLLERAMLLAKLPHQLLQPDALMPQQGYPLDWSLAQIEQHHLQQVLIAQQGNKSQAAQLLGISRKTLDRKLASQHSQTEL